MPAPLAATRTLAEQPPAYSPLLDTYDSRQPLENHMSTSDALGLLETQGLVAALHATDDMLKAAAVQLVGKEKIGAAYVTIAIRGDVAAVQAAIAVGRETVERLGGKLILADVIPRPHAELAALCRNSAPCDGASPTTKNLRTKTSVRLRRRCRCAGLVGRRLSALLLLRGLLFLERALLFRERAMRSSSVCSLLYTYAIHGS